MFQSWTKPGGTLGHMDWGFGTAYIEISLAVVFILAWGR